MANDIDEIAKLKSFNSPFKLIRKALSSFFIVSMIGLGFFVNWILALVFLITCFSTSSWWLLLIGLGLMIVVFPVVYLFLAYSYGQSILFWEVYKEGLRPLIAKFFSGLLDTFLSNEAKEDFAIDENRIVKEIEERQKNFLERLPDFIRAYFQLFFNSKDIIKIVKEQRRLGTEKEAVKQKAMKHFFEGLDLQLSELMEPSLIPFYIVGAINCLVFYFIF